MTKNFVQELLAACVLSALTVLPAHAGWQEKWHVPAAYATIWGYADQEHGDQRPHENQAFGDFNGDGFLEVLAWNNPNISILNGRTGAVLYSQSITSGVPYIATSILDLDGDGLSDAVIVVPSGTWVIGWSGAPDGVQDGVGPDPGAKTMTVAPNPAEGSGRIEFDLGSPDVVTVHIFDVSGRLVRDLATGQLQPGRQTVYWDGKDAAGVKLASGTYYCDLWVGKSRMSVSKMVLLH